jgi:hypothetical protein
MNNNEFRNDTILNAMIDKEFGQNPELFNYVQEYFNSDWPIDRKNYKEYMYELYDHDVIMPEEYCILISYID